MNHNDKLKIARQFKKKIADLEKQQDKLFKQAMRTLKIKDDPDSWAFEYFFNEDTDYYLDKMFGDKV